METADYKDIENEMGLTPGAAFPPFAEMFKERGAFVFGIVKEYKLVPYTPKTGPNAGKVCDGHYYILTLGKSNVGGLNPGEDYTISAPGLLHWQLTKGAPEGFSLPSPIGIRYEGKKDNMHQTRVSFPKVRAA